MPQEVIGMSDAVIGKLVVGVVEDRVCISIQDFNNHSSTTIYLLEADAITVLHNLKEAIELLHKQ